MKSSLVLHVPRSGSGFVLLDVGVRFKAVMSGFSGSASSGSLVASVISMILCHLPVKRFPRLLSRAFLHTSRNYREDITVLLSTMIRASQHALLAPFFDRLTTSTMLENESSRIFIEIHVELQSRGSFAIFLKVRPLPPRMQFSPQTIRPSFYFRAPDAFRVPSRGKSAEDHHPSKFKDTE